MANLAALHQLYASKPPVRALFDSIQSHGVEDERTTVDELIHDGFARRSAIDLLRELAELGCGEFKVGRKGHPSRLEWTGDPAQLVAEILDASPDDAAEPDESDVAPETDVEPDDDHDDDHDGDHDDEPDDEPAFEPEVTPNADDDSLGLGLELAPSESEGAIQRTFDLGEDAAASPPAKPARRGRAKAKPSARAPQSRESSERIEHVFVLRPDVRVQVELPADLSAREAEVLASWIGSLSFER